MIEQQQMPTQAAPEQVPAQATPEQGQGQGDIQVSPEAQPYYEKAVKLLYEENYDNLIKMMSSGGTEGFAENMANAVLGVLERLEKEAGQLPDQILAEVGSAIFQMLVEDLVGGGVIQNIDKNVLLEALQIILQRWSESHPGRFDPEEAMAAMQQQLGGM